MKEVEGFMDGKRRDFKRTALDESSLYDNPMEQFKAWMVEAEQHEILDATSMVLSTSDGGQPSSRILYLRGLDDNALRFFTNYLSDKGKQIASNPQVSALFFWSTLERQVRIEGRCRKAAESVSDAYFAGRPRLSQLGAWASHQSERIEGRAQLEQQLKEVTERFQDAEVVPRPPHWGGYEIEPEAFEFWQGREGRLHDRVRYVKSNGLWSRERLSP